MSEELELGDCCSCHGTKNVRNLVMHNRRAPVPGTGWGCVVCNLSGDGAVSVICDDCLESNRPILEVCYGFPANKKRVELLGTDPMPFDHDLKRHREFESVYA